MSNYLLMTRLFSAIHDVNVSAGELNKDSKIKAFQWKMIFNANVSKQAQEVIFSQKIKKKTLILLWFSAMLLCLKLTHKHT